jgi:hypothetical protein
MARAAANQLAMGTLDASRTRGDSMRGVIKLTGTSPAVQAVLEVANNSAPVTLSGMVTRGMQKLEGAEVVVRGVRVGPRDIVVGEYHVRAMHGLPAYDGVLQASDDGYALLMSDGSGRKRISALPAALRDMTGARVWVAMPEGSSTPRSFGLIERR